MVPLEIIARGLLTFAELSTDKRDEQIEAIGEQLAAAGNVLAEHGDMLVWFISLLEREPSLYQEVDAVFRRNGVPLAQIKKNCANFVHWWNN